MVEKRAERTTSRRTPLPKRGFGPPLVRYVFHPPQVSVLCFPVQKSTTEQTRSSFGGVQTFPGERVLWYVVFLPPYVLHPPDITTQIASEALRRKHATKIAHQKLVGRGPKSLLEVALSGTLPPLIIGHTRVLYKGVF